MSLKDIDRKLGDMMKEEKIINKHLDIPFKDFMPGQVIQSSQFNDDMLDIEDKVNEVIDKHNLNVNKLHEHLDDKENPHEVNPHQIGTYEDSEIDEFIADIKNGNLNDEAIINRVLADACVDNRVLIDGAVTLSKLDTNIGDQIDISNNMSIKERYTKLETDAIIQEKVGDGTYSKEQIDAKFEEYQAGTIVDGTVDVSKLKGDVGRKLDIEHNPSISNRYTKSEVNTLIAKNGLPKDWGNLSDEVGDEIVTQNGLGSLPISDVMVCGEFKATKTDVLNIKVQDVEFAKGEFNTLEDRLDNVDLRLTNIVLNIFDYSDSVVVVNGKEDWKSAFDKAFEDLQDGGTLLIPKHNYYISSRSILKNKKNIIINCAGTIMPMDNVKPLIGTFTFRDLKECTFNGLCLDGNASNVTPTNSYGTHSLLCIEDSSNIVFNNLVIKNTYESGVTSNGNLSNVIFNNVDLNNMGEHGFYFGGTNVKNVTFNNINCINIGTSSPNKDRSVAVIKFRNKVVGNILHDNINVNNFYFENTFENTWHDGNTRDFIHGFDCKNINIKNGTVKGDNTCIFQTNVCVDNFIVDSVSFDGKYFNYDIKSVHGYNEVTNIEEYGKCIIKYVNCNLKGCSRNISLLKFENCNIELTGNCTDSVVSENLLFDNFSKCYFKNCEISPNTARFSVKKATRLILDDVYFKNLSIGSQPLFDLSLPSSSVVEFNRIDMNSEITLFLTSNTDVYCNITNSKIKGYIKSTVKLLELVVSNSFLKEYRLNTYASYDKLKVNGVYRLDGERVDFNIHKQKCLKSNTETTLSLQYKRVENITEDKLLITNDKNIPYTVTINNNILTLSTINTQSSDTIFTVVYIA